MKKYIYLFIILFSAASCSDWLVEEPKSIAAETFYNTEAEVAAAVAAPLANLRDKSLDYFGVALCECFSDYAYGRGGWASNSYYAGLDNTNQTRTSDLWTKLYTSVRNCNVALERLPDANQMSEEKISNYTGELKFIRGLAYFYLVRYFGDIPIHIEENMSEYNISISQPAYDDIASITDYFVYNLKDGDMGFSIADRIFDAIASLEQMPLRHRAFYKEVRAFPILGYFTLN